MRKVLLTFVIIISLILSACSSKESGSVSTDYPKRPIELVVPFGEGSASDTFARKFAEIMSKNMAKPFQPVNKDGSGGLVGMVYAHGQSNDGYTVLEVTPSHVIADVLEKGKNLKFLEEFEPLARIQEDIYVLSVPANSEIDSFDKLLEIGKEKEVTFAGVSPGGLDDLTLSALADATGLKVKFIPYGSGSEVKAAVLGGEVDVYLDKLINTVSYIKDGKVRPIIVLNDERITQIDELKDTPSTVEKGFDITIGSWRGFVVKKDTPQEVKDYLIDQMKKAYETEEYQKFNEESLTNIRDGFLGPEDFKASMLEDFEMFDKVAKQIGLK
ncbi:tripartite tricarboxylate transporter substrate binding protein [Bacillus sp. DTU_2020_1000418_1_SI_GHA_SEK_038]|uniref:Bug family tripartite tricarboxylate transporter substrate binding protein n=1 Tax=Bacillus sp. DTU_2020_1000418_1_SI_GHA_SEK_038 TaxID=3077585 RepID=UPI0028E2D2F9|nr:tripartite tricarboxylate transporter substrate binding protein [Bacillus sp. DTU_2020_1000418_1_SI_GHA_SEK_038]WNS75359.1 tripartite tricarboxylate transporter substrate binding protein [Bacillus sp. DTU_2020_1000418_1_SI_GHA_SEK_038]